MRYLVMECRLSYAVVLDSRGRFIKVANLGYQVGQSLDSVVELRQPEAARGRHRALLSIAACLCLALLGGYQLLLYPFGTVRLQINPDVVMTVNRLNYVVGLEGLNPEGVALAQGLQYYGKRMEILADMLADRAQAMGYLGEEGRITVSAQSQNQDWKTAAEELLILELRVHLEQQVQVVAGDEDEDDHEPAAAPQRTANPEAGELPVIPLHPAAEEEGSDSSPGDDDWDEDMDDAPEYGSGDSVGKDADDFQDAGDDDANYGDSDGDEDMDDGDDEDDENDDSGNEDDENDDDRDDDDGDDDDGNDGDRGLSGGGGED